MSKGILFIVGSFSPEITGASVQCKLIINNILLKRTPTSRIKNSGFKLESKGYNL